MIEEPKQPGFYWIRYTNGRSEILWKNGEYWSRFDELGEWDFANMIYGLTPLAIEPVTPPSWERKS